VERFTSRQVAAARIWKAIQNLQPTAGARKQASKTASARNKGTAGPDNTKTAKVIALLEQPEGATLEAIMRMPKPQRGLKVRSSKRDGERVYFIKR
jgi:hypothetical protein